MTTTLQPWGNSQGIRLPKQLLTALGLETGAALEITLTAQQDGLLIRQAIPKRQIRGRHRIEDLLAAMPADYQAEEVFQDQQGREVW